MCSHPYIPVYVCDLQISHFYYSGLLIHYTSFHLRKRSQTVKSNSMDFQSNKKCQKLLMGFCDIQSIKVVLCLIACIEQKGKLTENYLHLYDLALIYAKCLLGKTTRNVHIWS